MPKLEDKRRDPCDETSTMRSIDAGLRLSTLSAWGLAVSCAERSKKPLLRLRWVNHFLRETTIRSKVLASRFSRTAKAAFSVSANAQVFRAHNPAGQHNVGRQDEIEIVKSFLWSTVAEAAPRHGGRQRKTFVARSCRIFTGNLVTNETAELELRRGFRGQNHHRLNNLMPRSSTFDLGDMHANISAHASDNILGRFQKPPLLLVCVLLGAAHAIYLLVKKYLNYRVCLKLG
jgi:hypothetical protein